MLDLLISYINFFILSIKLIVKKILFQPPNPKTYKIVEISNNEKDNYEIYIKNNNQKFYHKIKKRVQIDIRFIKIPDKHNINIPTFIFKPTFCLHRACIIYCHGNSCDIGSTFNECCDLSKLTKCIVISFDYPGYGIYENKEPNENNIYETLQIIYDFVKEKLKFDENNIIVYGFSLGTGVAFDLACKNNYNFAGLILQSPFLSIFRAIYNTKNTKYFDLFNSCDKAKMLKIKTLFIHGNKDGIVPYIHGRILSKLIPKNKLYSFQTIDGAGHNDIFSAKNLISLSEIIKDFIEQCCNINKFKDNKTERNKKINKINYNFDVNHKINNSFSKFKNVNKLFNTTINESRKVDINENEIENKSLSENNSAFLVRKKDSFLEIFESSKNEESKLIKTNSKYKIFLEEKNGIDSVEKLLKNEKNDNKDYISDFSYNNNYNNQNSINNKAENNSNNYNDLKTVNITDSNFSQKEDFSANGIVLMGKNNKLSLEKIINISKSE